MTADLEAEIRATAGELVGLLRTISEGVTPLRRPNIRTALLEAENALRKPAWLADQLPWTGSGGWGKAVPRHIDIMLMVVALVVSIWWLGDYIVQPVAKWKDHARIAPVDDGYLANATNKRTGQ